MAQAADDKKTTGGYCFYVIIPIYQAKEPLPACVESLRAAAAAAPEADVTLLLVDDGSTDGSSELVDRLAGDEAHSLHIHVRHTDNRGVSHARNTALSMADEFISQLPEGADADPDILFVDADDTVGPDLFKRLTALRKQYPTARLLATGGVDPHEHSGLRWSLEDELLEEDTHVWGKCFPRSAIGDLRFPEDLTIGEDLLFLAEYVLGIGRATDIVCISAIDYRYTVNSDGAMLRPFTNSYLDQLTCWIRFENLLDSIAAGDTSVSAGHLGRLSPFIRVKLSAIQIQAAFLVIGKLAVSDCEGREHALSEADRLLRHALRTRGAFAAIPPGHQIKTILYRISPALYLRMYGRWKGSKP